MGGHLTPICPGRPRSFFHSWWDVYKLWVLPTSLTSPPGPDPAPLTTHTFSALLSPLWAFALAVLCLEGSSPRSMLGSLLLQVQGHILAIYSFPALPGKEAPNLRPPPPEIPWGHSAQGLVRRPPLVPWLLYFPSSYTIWISVGGLFT